jgi:hypothetical protein
MKRRQSDLHNASKVSMSPKLSKVQNPSEFTTPATRKWPWSYMFAAGAVLCLLVVWHGSFSGASSAPAVDAAAARDQG